MNFAHGLPSADVWTTNRTERIPLRQYRTFEVLHQPAENFLLASFNLLIVIMEANTTGAANDAMVALLRATEFLPSNPVTPYFEYGWKHMTDNYTKFQIAILGSIIAHEVSHFVLTKLLAKLLQ